MAELAAKEASPTAAEVFRQAVKDLRARARLHGIPMQDLCDAQGVSRSTTIRWTKKVPQSVTVLTKLQEELDRRVAAMAESVEK